MHVYRTLQRIGFFCLALAFLSGCTAPQVGGPTSATLQIADRDVFINRALTMLREHHMPPRFVDRDLGRIETRRATGGQLLELWRSDVHGGYQLLESSLHTIGRTTTITLEPTTPGNPQNDETLLVTVDVRKERYSAPERQVTTASGALGIYNERVPTYSGLRGYRGRFETWVPIGRDPLLEQALLGELSELANGIVRAPTPPAPRQAAPAPRPRPQTTPAPRPQPRSGDGVVVIEPA